MGIDKPDVRFVVHYSLPKAIEGYYQECGRAGRDGLPAAAVLLYAPRDAGRVANLLRMKGGARSKTYPAAVEALGRMKAYAEERGRCRREHLADFFGEAYDPARCRRTCDTCLRSQQAGPSADSTGAGVVATGGLGELSLAPWPIGGAKPAAKGSGGAGSDGRGGRMKRRRGRGVAGGAGGRAKKRARGGARGPTA